MAEVKKLSTWRWRSPYVQTIFCSAITAATAGLYVALTGLGSGGGKPTSQTVAAQTNAIEDALWAVSSLLGSVMFNAWGIKWTLAHGASGFPLYLAGFWIYDRTGKAWAPPLLGGLSGLTAGGLRVVQTGLPHVIPRRTTRVFTCSPIGRLQIIKTGAVIGSLIALGINVNRTEASVAWDLYLVFFLIMSIATIAALFVAEPSTIRRNDGTALARFEPVPFKQGLKEMWRAIASKQMMLMALPLFVVETPLAPNSSVNSYSFTLRTRTLDNLLYWLVPILLMPVFWWLADNKRWSRPTRAYILTTFVLIFHLGGWIGGEILVSQKAYRNRHLAGPGIDWEDEKYGPLCVLYMVWGIGYALYFQLRLWFIGALSNDPQTLARYCALIPAFQAAGICIAFGIDSTKLPYWQEFTVWFTLIVASFACLYYLVAAGYVQKTMYFKEDKVIVPIHVAKDLGVEEEVDVATGETHQITISEEKRV